MPIKSEFATSDLSTITVVSASGIDPLRVERDETGKRVIFVFAKTEYLDQLLADFWSNSLKLPALQLLTQLKTIKSQIYNT